MGANGKRRRRRRSPGPCVFLRGGRYWARLGSFQDVLPLTSGGKPREVEPLVPDGAKRATDDKALAEQLLEIRIEQLKDARRRGMRESAPRTFRQVAVEYLEDEADHDRVTDDWLAKMEKYLDGACEVLGERDVRTVRPRDIRATLDWLRDHKAGRGRPTLSGSTLRHYFYAISAAFDYAVAEDWLTENPAKLVEARRRPHMDTGSQPWFEPHEAALYLEAARLHARPKGTAPMAYPFAYPLIATFLLTGGRKAEVLGLAVEDVDFAANVIRIRPHPWRRLKNKGSERAVPLWPQLRTILRAYLDGPHAPKGRLLFPGVGDEMVVDIRKTLDAVSALCGWPEGVVTPKRFRHAYASARVHTAGGDAIFNVSREMGHTSLAMIAGVYAHYFPAGTEHRATLDVLEFKVENHAEELADELTKLRAKASKGAE